MKLQTFKRNAGFTLIEILIAVLLLAVGVLGLAAAQLGALKYNQTSSSRTQASFLAYSIVDAMRANKVNAPSYDIAINAAAPTGNSIAATDIRNWQQSLSTQLPSGTGSIARGTGASSNVVTVTVRWSEGRVGGNTETGSSAGDTQTFVMVTQI